MKNHLDECLRKFVSVDAAGIRYHGELIEVGDEEIILRTPSRWISVPVDKIASVQVVDRSRVEEPAVEDVDADEFVVDGEE